MKVSAAIDLALALLEQGAHISHLIRIARADGREELNDEEWNSILTDNNAARERLAAAIDARAGNATK